MKKTFSCLLLMVSVISFGQLKKATSTDEMLYAYTFNPKYELWHNNDIGFYIKFTTLSRMSAPSETFIFELGRKTEAVASLNDLLDFCNTGRPNDHIEVESSKNTTCSILFTRFNAITYLQFRQSNVSSYAELRVRDIRKCIEYISASEYNEDSKQNDGVSVDLLYDNLESNASSLLSIASTSPEKIDTNRINQIIEVLQSVRK